MKRFGFTLVEVNLAVMIMATGVLSIIGLYAFGYRENQQSREDCAATALADAVISPLVMAITATNLKWSVFRQEFNYPSAAGWEPYFNARGEVTQDPQALANNVWGQTLTKLRTAAKGTLQIPTAFPSTAGSGMSCGLVVQHDEDSPIVRICFRATPKPGVLLSMPIFYTEARFQGLPDE